MAHKVVTFFLNFLIAGAVILFSLSLSFILIFLLLQFNITSSEINSALISMFVSGVVVSLSISIKNVFNKELKLLPQYIFIGKIIAILVVGMMIIRYYSFSG